MTASLAMLWLALGATHTSAITPSPQAHVSGRAFEGAYRVLDDKEGLSSGSVFEDVQATVLRGGFRIRGGAHDVEIRRVRLSLARPTSPPELPAGIELQESANHITLTDVTATGFQMVPVPGRYTNGDGFSTEKDVHDIRFVRAQAFDNSDGGFDLKGEVALDDCTSGGNTRDLRVWGAVTATRLTLLQPIGHGGRAGPAYVWLEKGSRLTVERLVAKGSVPTKLFECDGEATIIINDYALELPQGTPLTYGPCHVQWGSKGAPRLGVSSGVAS